MSDVTFPGCVPDDIKSMLSNKINQTKFQVSTRIDDAKKEIMKNKGIGSKQSKKFKEMESEIESTAIKQVSEEMSNMLGRETDALEFMEKLTDLSLTISGTPTCVSVNDFNDRLKVIEEERANEMIDEMKLHDVIPSYKKPSSVRVIGKLEYGKELKGINTSGDETVTEVDIEEV